MIFPPGAGVEVLTGMKRTTLPITQRLEWLGECALFAELPRDMLLSLAEAASTRFYEPGELLFREGERADGLHIVADGQVKVCRYGADGREQILHIFGGVDPCGEVAVFEGGCYPATAEALAASNTLFLLRSDFLALAARQPDLLLNMLAVLSRRLRRFVDMIDDLALKEVSTRLARHLLELSAQAGGAREVELATSKAMLAARLGAVAETLSRTLARMQRRGLIEVDGRRVRLRNLAGLRGLAEGDKL